jgi:ATP-dependent Clp protease protease subunit
VIPSLAGDATEQTPPDLPSYLFKERIVYMGMSLVPAVTELMLAELLYLQYDNPNKPIYMYINSTGVGVRCYIQNILGLSLYYNKQNKLGIIVQRGGDKLGYEAEAFAIYDTMRYIKPPVYTICVGNAFGEAAMLLAAGKEGNRAALPSASIMLRQPMQRFTQMQASDIDIYRNEIRKTNTNVVNLLSKHIGHPVEKISKDILRPRYFNPYEAVEYGIIDNVLEPDDEAFKNLVRAQSQL